MTTTTLLMLAIFVLGVGALVGFFKTKTDGFGRFTTSTFLILLVVIISSLLYAAGKLDGQIMANVLFAVFGFAGGLFTSKDGTSKPTA
jgi:uncharacterized membrane protein